LTQNKELARVLATDHLQASVTARQRAILTYADKLTRAPGSMVEADLDAMRAEGMSDRDVLDVNQTVAYFAYVNRVADGLGVATDQYARDEFPI
jgi:uncharacterized peroxidase-related enzyme